MNTPPVIEYTVNFMGIDRPSQALRAIIDGLLEASERPTFTIEMSTFGDYQKDIDMCFGCAATCTLMKLSGRERMVKDTHERYERYESKGIRIGSIPSPGFYFSDHAVAITPEYMEYYRSTDFESAVDSLRRGGFKDIFDFFGFRAAPHEDRNLIGDYISTLTNENWKDNICKYEILHDYWVSNGY